MRLTGVTDRRVRNKLVALLLDEKKVVHRPFEKYVVPVHKTVGKTVRAKQPHLRELKSANVLVEAVNERHC